MASFWYRKINPALNQVGRGFWQRGFLEPQRRLYDHQLVFFDSGDCEVTIASERHIMKPGDWIIIPPDILHSSRSLSDHLLRFWVHFDWVDEDREPTPLYCYAPDQPDASKIHRAPEWAPVKHSGSCSQIERVAVLGLLEALEVAWNHSDEVEFLTSKAIFMELLFRLLRPRPEHMKQNSLKNDSILLQVKNLLDQAPSSQFSIREILCSTGQTYEHLCRRFTAYFGISPLRYLNGIRLEKAKKLLLRSNAPVNEIAWQSGFNDPVYFGKLFRKHYHFSPGEYRKHIRSGIHRSKY